ALVLLPLPQRRLEIGDGLVPKLPGGVGDPPLIVIPPAPTPDLARRHAVLSTFLHVYFALLHGASCQPHKHSEEKMDRQTAWKATGSHAHAIFPELSTQAQKRRSVPAREPGQGGVQRSSPRSALWVHGASRPLCRRDGAVLRAGLATSYPG